MGGSMGALQGWPSRRAAAHAPVDRSTLAQLARQTLALVLAVAGDHIYKMDYAKMLAEHVERGADMTVGCVEVPVAEASKQLGVMEVDRDFRVVGFEEKPLHPKTVPGTDDCALGSMGI